MNKYQPFLTLWISALIVIGYGCVDHDLPLPPPVDCNSANPEISFTNHVKPIIDTKCAIIGEGGCHNGDNGADLDWRVFQNFKDHAEEVQDRITRALGADGKMPKIDSISNAKIQTIYCWVEQGAKNN